VKLEISLDTGMCVKQSSHTLSVLHCSYSKIP